VKSDIKTGAQSPGAISRWLLNIVRWRLICMETWYWTFFTPHIWRLEFRKICSLCSFKILSCGMWLCVVGRVVPHVRRIVVPHLRAQAFPDDSLCPWTAVREDEGCPPKRWVVLESSRTPPWESRICHHITRRSPIFDSTSSHQCRHADFSYVCDNGAI